MTVVRVSIEQASKAGKAEACVAVAIETTDTHYRLDRADWLRIRGDAPLPSGPGSQLKQLLKRIGITPAPDCKCNAHARTMDANGPQWCRDNLDTITGWLRDEAHRRKLPFVDVAGRALVRRAIRNAER